ncbi:MAG: DNA repair protein RecO [Chitinophagales bacterium]|nr:DNA repair protein RecO [Chitinophagales bacterium]
MTHATKGIVLRAVKYGETSLIVLVFTELFGIQSYIVNGVRTAKKGSAGANCFMPGAILDLVVYHQESKNIQRIKEYRWHRIYQHLFSDIPRHAVSQFMVELMTKCLKQPEANADLFHFCEDALLHLDESTDPVMANFSLYFALNFATFFGFRIDDRQSSLNSILDLQEGCFVDERPGHPYFMEGEQARVCGELLHVMQPGELEGIRLNRDFRRQLLFSLENYYALHVQDFGVMKTLAVLREVL